MTNQAGDQAFVWQDMNTPFTHSAGQLHAFWQGGQTIVEGDTNGDGKADFSIALDGHLTLGAGDFIL